MLYHILTQACFAFYKTIVVPNEVCVVGLKGIESVPLSQSGINSLVYFLKDIDILDPQLLQGIFRNTKF